MRSAGRLLATIFNRRWWWVTLLVVLGMLLLVRLGIWQLDRLAQRRAFNAQVSQHLAAAPLKLTAEAELPDDPTLLRHRPVEASGAYDFSEQIFLDQQRWQGQLGGHLVAPLVLPGGEKAVLVDRGWLPAEMADPSIWPQFDETGQLTITGYAQPPQTLPGGRSVIPDAPQQKWFRLDIRAIQQQMPYELLPIYILQSPTEGRADALPYRAEPEIDLSEGPHMGYALQWFIFAMILGGGYLALVHQMDNE